MRLFFDDILSNFNLFIAELSKKPIGYPPVGVVDSLVSLYTPNLNDDFIKNYIGVMIEYIFIRLGYTKGIDKETDPSRQNRFIKNGMMYH